VFRDCLNVSQDDLNQRLMEQENKKCCVTHDFYTHKTVLLRLYGSMLINGLMVAFTKLKRLPLAERSLHSAAKCSIMRDLKLLLQCS